MRLPQSVRRTGAAVIGRIPMRIRGGPNRGMRWSIASAGRGALSGTFEQERVAAITRMIRPGDCVWDIGAHKGYVTLAAARRAGPEGHVYAIEPSPPNLEYLERHLAWNEVSNVDIVRVAVSSTDGTSIFGGPGGSTTHRLGRGQYTVQMRTVGSLLKDGLRPPDIIKIDVEWHESEVLRGAVEHVSDSALLFIAIHNLEQYEACMSQLRLLKGWRVVHSGRISKLLSRKPIVWSADPDIVAIGPKREIDSADLAAFQDEETS